MASKRISFSRSNGPTCGPVNIDRVEDPLAFVELVVQMGSRASPGVSAFADHLPSPHILADPNGCLFKVQVLCERAIREFDFHAISVRTRVPIGARHSARSRRQCRGPHRRLEVHTRVGRTVLKQGGDHLVVREGRFLQASRNQV